MLRQRYGDTPRVNMGIEFFNCAGVTDLGTALRRQRAHKSIRAHECDLLFGDGFELTAADD